MSLWTRTLVRVLASLSPINSSGWFTSDAGGTSFEVETNTLDAAGTTFTLETTTLDASGTSYSLI